MTRKLSYQEVYDYFKEQGCELLEESYTNAHTKMKFKCSCGNIGYKNLAHFKRGQRCKECGSKNRSQSQRLKFQDVKEYIESNSYTLVSDVYIKAKSKIHVKCENNHDYFVTFDAFKRGNRCPQCSERNSYDINSTREIFEKENCKLLVEQYKNSITPMEYVCSCGNVSRISLDSFIRGSRCNDCGIKKSQEKQKKDFNIIAEHFKNNNCILISVESEYENKYSPLKYICECGNVDTTTWGSFRNDGTRCKECRRKKISEKHRGYTIEELMPYFKKRGFILTSTEYINSHTPLEFICDKGHNAKTHIYHFFNGAGCMQCAIENRKGENSPNWNPNRTDEERIFRRQYNGYKEWRTSVFERDNYTCQCCGKRGGVYLHAHHLDNHAEFIDKRLDTDNGITLCEECHDDFHNMYGTKENTREEFEEYMTGISWNCSKLFV